MKAITIIIKQIRLHHWLKNLLVFAPLFFGGSIFDRSLFFLTSILFFSFSFLASSIYIINDIFDLKQDRLHSNKCKRPIASGQLSIKQALLIFTLLIILAIYLASFLNIFTQLILILYFVLNIAYSFRLKHIPIVDICILAFMFFLRIQAGGEAVEVYLSDWLILVTFFLALFLVAGKRKAEFLSQQKNPKNTRLVLGQYSDGLLTQIITIIGAGVVLSYALYTIEVDRFYLLWSSFFVIFGVFRCLYLIDQKGKGEDLIKLLWADIWLTITIMLWSVYVFLIFYII